MGPEQSPADDEFLFFEDLIAQAVAAPDDDFAQTALLSHVQEVIDRGDMERIMVMGMMIGATACLHEHMETAANMFSEVVARQNDEEAHRSQSRDTKKIAKKKKDSKNKPRSSFFLLAVGS